MRVKSLHQMDIEERQRRDEMHSTCINGKTCNYCLKSGVCIEDIGDTQDPAQFKPYLPGSDMVRI